MEKQMTPTRRYKISGTDDLGDVHTFETDDLERAEEIKAIMGEELEDVQLTDVEGTLR
jgi:hypothetical protein